MILHRAAWVLPVAAPPIRDGWVAVEAGRIVACGAGDPPAGSLAAAPAFETEPAAIMPAVVNAHTHLELSYMRGLVPPAPSFEACARCGTFAGSPGKSRPRTWSIACRTRACPSNWPTWPAPST